MPKTSKTSKTSKRIGAQVVAMRDAGMLFSVIALRLGVRLEQAIIAYRATKTLTLPPPPAPTPEPGSR